MTGEIIPGLPKQARDLLLYDPHMPPLDLITDETHIDPDHTYPDWGTLICEQRVSLENWASPGTISLRVSSDRRSLYGYPAVGHEPGTFITLDGKDQSHEYTVEQIFPFNPPELPVDQRPADILDSKLTGRLELMIKWDHDPYEFDNRGRFKNPETRQDVDPRIETLPIAIKIGRVILMALPDVEVSVLQQGLQEYTSYEHFILYGKTNYFTAEPDAPEPRGYVGAEVIVPMNIELLKSARLLFLNTQLAPILSERTNLGLPTAQFMQKIVSGLKPQIPVQTELNTT